MKSIDGLEICLHFCDFLSNSDRDVATQLMFEILRGSEVVLEVEMNMLNGAQ